MSEGPDRGEGTSELLRQAIAALPAYVDREVLQLVIQRYPADAQLQFVGVLSEVLLPDTGAPNQDLSYSLWVEGDSEVTALLGRLIALPSRQASGPSSPPGAAPG